MKSPARRLVIGVACALSLFLARISLAGIFTVDVGGEGGYYGEDMMVYSPAVITIAPGDTIEWVWEVGGHSTTSGTLGNPSGLWDSGVLPGNSSFSHTFPDPGSFAYYCSVHGTCCNMIGTVNVVAPSPTPSPTPRPPSEAQLLNISTRMRVQTGDNVLIGGFIVTGNDAKKVILRAIGPSLTQFGVVDALADPVLELHGSDGSLITSNDNWKETQESEIDATGLAPQGDLEPAIIATLDPDAYTAIMSGKDGTSGVGLVEGYDLDQAADSQLANISTRGFVETESNVMIGGFILGSGSGTTNILVRAIGPSLTLVGVSDALADPTLELHDANGALIMSNDNWKESQEAEIESSGLAPQDDLESAVLVTVATNAYTAIVVGKDGGTGVALVEVYRMP